MSYFKYYQYITVIFRHVHQKRMHTRTSFIHINYYSFTEANLSIAFSVFSFVLNAVRRKYPSPALPKPAPGVPATPASSSLSKKSQEGIPPGVFSHIYGELTPP